MRCSIRTCCHRNSRCECNLSISLASQSCPIRSMACLSSSARCTPARAMASRATRSLWDLPRRNTCRRISCRSSRRNTTRRSKSTKSHRRSRRCSRLPRRRLSNSLSLLTRPRLSLTLRMYSHNRTRRNNQHSRIRAQIRARTDRISRCRQAPMPNTKLTRLEETHRRDMRRLSNSNRRNTNRTHIRARTYSKLNNKPNNSLHNSMCRSISSRAQESTKEFLRRTGSRNNPRLCKPNRM